MRRRRSLVGSLLGLVFRSASTRSRTSSRRGSRGRGPLYTAVAVLSAFGAYHGGYLDSFLDSIPDYIDGAKAQVAQLTTSLPSKLSDLKLSDLKTLTRNEVAPRRNEVVSHRNEPASSNEVASSRGNTTNDSFQQAKRTLEQKIVNDRRITIYCSAPFDSHKKITLPPGFTTPSHEKRATKVEWEHVVPAENFGRFFKEWREGDPQCVDNKGKSFKGRNCAEKVNMQYRYMQADMHNLFPAIGAVNALRSNYNFVQFPASVKPMFGTCEMKISDRKAEPPDSAKGPVARATLYMDWAYPIFNLSNQQRQLMQAWNKEFPPEAWECERERRVAKIQGNPNPFVEELCVSK